MKRRRTDDRKEHQRETRHCASCGGEQVHLIWVLRATVERKCLDCGRSSSGPRKPGVVERQQRQEEAKRSPPGDRWNQQAREAQRALDRVAAKRSRQGKRGGWGFSTHDEEG